MLATKKKRKSDQSNEFARMRTEHFDDDGVESDDNPRVCHPEEFTPEEHGKYVDALRSDDLDGFLDKHPHLDLRPKAAPQASDQGKGAPTSTSTPSA